LHELRSEIKSRKLKSKTIQNLPEGWTKDHNDFNWIFRLDNKLIYDNTS
jgi:hypothetical protein